VSNATPLCPTCGTALGLNPQGDFHAWVCPNGHGLAATLTEGYHKVQDDELHQLWKLAKTAAPGDRKCPMCEQPMVVVDLGWDSDEVEEGTAGDGADEGHEELDVCKLDEVIWFDAGELEALPADLPNAEPTPEQQAQITQIADTFVSDYTNQVEQDIHSGLVNRFADHYQTRHPRRASLLDVFYRHGTTSMTN
jgi:Zn-finger nucleic acid-binding protein